MGDNMERLLVVIQELSASKEKAIDEVKAG
jgi:hypothetical protein